MPAALQMAHTGLFNHQTLQRHNSVSAMPTSGFSSMTEPFSPLPTNPPGPLNRSYSYTLSPIGQPPSYDLQAVSRIPDTDRISPASMASFGTSTTVILRHLPKNTTDETLRSMLLFVGHLNSVEFVPNDNTNDDGKFVSAIAHFETTKAADEACAMLNGKPNSTNEANMIVESVPSSIPPPYIGRRNTIDHSSSRGSVTPTEPRLARFMSPFPETAEQGSMANGAVSNGELPAPDSKSRLPSLFSEPSPIGHALSGLPQVSGKSVIDEGLDEETGELLKDPVAYARNEPASSTTAVPRRSTNPSIPTAHFGGLSLATNIPPSTGMQSFSARTPLGPASALSPSLSGNLNGSFHNNLPYHRPNYPPVNPADQNPPCNTLYVGNLPHDTSEDELKALFSKQRGYKRLCFRNKQNGPMCFVEFEDVSFATKTLHDLYGWQLSNSVKGGIRLSFSKNPLGVRNTPIPDRSVGTGGPMGGINGFGSIPGPMFSTASGPPPGLSAPPGLVIPTSTIGGGSMASPFSPTANGFANSPLGLGMGSPPGSRSNSVFSPSPLNGAFAHPLGGLSGPSYADFMVGR